MQKLALLGNIGQDASIRQVGEDSVISFSIGCSIKLRDGTQKTTWYNCSIWNKQNLVEHLKKGTKLYVEGTPNIHSYEDKNGVKQSIIQLTVREIHFGGNSKPNEATPAPASGTPENHPAMNSTIPPASSDVPPVDDDLPF